MVAPTKSDRSSSAPYGCDPRRTTRTPSPSWLCGPPSRARCIIGSRWRKTWMRASPRPSRIASAALALHEGEPRQRDHQRREIERVGDEFLGQLERRVHHDAFAAIRRLALHQEVAAVEVRRVAVVDEIAADHLVTGGAQHVDDVAGAARTAPTVDGAAARAAAAPRPRPAASHTDRRRARSARAAVLGTSGRASAAAPILRWRTNFSPLASRAQWIVPLRGGLFRGGWEAIVAGRLAWF